MSFTTDIRGELARVRTVDACCARSELASALLISGGIAWRGKGRYALTLTASEAATVRHFFATLKAHWGIVGQIRALSGDALNGLTRYQLAVPESASLQLLGDCGLMDEGALFGLRSEPEDFITRYACCKKAFVRAAFLMAGEVSNPEKTYHFEISAPTQVLSERLGACLRYFEIPSATSRRKSKYVVYLKRMEHISDTLSLLGAGTAVLNLQNIQINKEVRNRVNRLMNWDQANINRAVEAAAAQVEAIQLIDRELGLDRLPTSLRDMAIARVNYPEMPLSSLGDMLETPIGKSGVNARLRRLMAIADKLRSGEEVKLRSSN